MLINLLQPEQNTKLHKIVKSFIVIWQVLSLSLFILSEVWLIHQSFLLSKYFVYHSIS